ncbi:hypothetical protein [uncultured Croceicoccus sp.]|uniref:hypothetical protein n=1 Tax=uncultured Croceicoccus sp. TaxID=1295329 RepID=UPI00262A6F4F|nr:hypothetical protein [uncultured Croceicoccus sp.]
MNEQARFPRRTDRCQFCDTQDRIVLKRGEQARIVGRPLRMLFAGIPARRLKR